MLVDDDSIDALLNNKAQLPTVVTYCQSLLNVLRSSNVSYMFDKWLHQEEF